MPTEMFSTTEYNINGNPYTARDLHGSGGSDTTYTLSADGQNVKLTPSSGSPTTASLTELINGLPLAYSTPSDNDYYISQYVNGGSSNTNYYRRSISKLFDYIKGKLGIANTGDTFLKKDGTWGLPSQLTYIKDLGSNYVMSASDFVGVGIYKITSLKANDSTNPYNAPDFNSGDFYVYSTYNGDSNYTTLILTSPRLAHTVYYGFFWQGVWKGWRDISKNDSGFVTNNQNAVPTSNPWFKIAEIEIVGTNEDVTATFLVEEDYPTNRIGLLSVRTRFNGTTLSVANISFISNTSFTPSNFVLAYATDSGKAEIWVKLLSAYHAVRMTTLSEGKWGTAYNSSFRWKMLSTATAGSQAEPTSGYTQVVATNNNLSVTNITASGTVMLTRNVDGSGTSNNKPALIVGGTDTQAHIEIDANEVMAKNNGTTPTVLYLNMDGGDVQIGGASNKQRVTIKSNSGDTPAAGAVQSVMNVAYKNADGSKTYSTDPINIIGTDGTDTYNTGISLGSRNGTTFVSAGESANSLPAAMGAYNNENLYLTADGSINFVTNSSNDASSYKTATLTQGVLSGVNTTFYGTCNTAAGTRDKVITIDNAGAFALIKGVTIIVQFTSDSNTVANPRLNVRGTGAIDIKYNNAVVTNNASAGGVKNAIITYVYDGTYWNWVCKNYDNNTTYSAMSKAEAVTGTATNLRTVRADYLNAAIKEICYPVGCIIHSTTLSTKADVIAAFGGIDWLKHEPYFLKAATEGVETVTFNQAIADGGAFTTTISSVANHNHTQNAHSHPIRTHLANGGNTTSTAYYGSPYAFYQGGNFTIDGNITNLGGAQPQSVLNATATNVADGSSYTVNITPPYKNVYIWERVE